MHGFVYILKDKNNKLYIGSTTDINRRFDQHLHGHTQTTKKMQDLEIVFSQKFNDVSVARNVERKLKKLKRKDYIEKVIKDGFIKLTRA